MNAFGILGHLVEEVVDPKDELADLDEVAADGTVLDMNPVGLIMVEAGSKEKVIGIGLFTSVTLEKNENEAISFHINASDRKFKEWQEYPAGDGLIIKMPFFNMRAIDTHLMLKTNEWVTLGGLVDERSDGKKMSLFMGIRIIPPTTDK